jgi:hypothetical protein
MSPKDTRAAVVTAFAVLAALAAGTALTSMLPSSADVSDAPFVTTGSVGQEVRLRTGTMTVLGIDASTTIKNDLDTAVSEHGTFLIVKLRWIPSPKPEPLTGLSIRTLSGGSYHDASPITSGCAPAQTGIPIRCQVVFEMPSATLAGAVLVATSQGRGAEGDLQAEIDLGIDAASAAQLGAQTAPANLPAVEEGAR